MNSTRHPALRALRKPHRCPADVIRDRQEREHDRLPQFSRYHRTAPVPTVPPEPPTAEQFRAAYQRFRAMGSDSLTDFMVKTGRTGK